MKRAMALAVLLSVLFQAGAASADGGPTTRPKGKAAPRKDAAPPPLFQFSAYGVGAGRRVVAVGGKFVTIYSMFHMAYSFGLSDRITVAANIDTLGVSNALDLAFRLRLFGSPAFALAVKAEVNTSFVFKSPFTATDRTGPGLGATPALLVSFGSQSFMVTLEVGVTMHYMGPGVVGGAFETATATDGKEKTLMGIQGRLYVERRFGRDTNFYIGLILVNVPDKEFPYYAFEMGISW